MGEKITRTDWLYGFTSLYEKISPLLDRITKKALPLFIKIMM